MLIMGVNGIEGSRRTKPDAYHSWLAVVIEQLSLDTSVLEGSAFYRRELGLLCERFDKNVVVSIVITI